MWRSVPDSIDRFPGDFVASLRSGAAAAIVMGATVWWFAQAYMKRTYPLHTEIFPAAIVVGLLDGIGCGVAGFVLTYVSRVWRYERRMRKLSDEALRRELESLERQMDR